MFYKQNLMYTYVLLPQQYTIYTYKGYIIFLTIVYMQDIIKYIKASYAVTYSIILN